MEILREDCNKKNEEWGKIQNKLLGYRQVADLGVIKLFF